MCLYPISKSPTESEVGGAHQLFNWVTNGASRQGLGQEKRRVKGAGRGKGLLVLTNGKEGRKEGRKFCYKVIWVGQGSYGWSPGCRAGWAEREQQAPAARPRICGALTLRVGERRIRVTEGLWGV